MSEKVRVVVEMSGGVCTAVYAGDFVEVVIFDHDDAKATEAGETYSPLICPPDAWTPEAQSIWDDATAASNRA